MSAANLVSIGGKAPRRPTSSDYSRHVLRAMLDAVMVVDLDGLIALANEATYRLLGYGAGELVGEPVARVFADEDTAMRTGRLSAPRPGLELRKEDVLLCTSDGARIPASVIGAALVDDNGTMSGVVLVVRDLRETKRLLAELASAKESLEVELDKVRNHLLNAERLATLGTLAGGVGHELCNILPVLLVGLGDLEELSRRNMVPVQLYRDLSMVAEHITDHARRLLTLARPGPDHLEPLDLNRVIEETLVMLREAGVTKRIEVETDLPVGPIVVTVNRTRIEQILVNLIGNAADALNGVRDRAARIEVRAELRGPRVVCRVFDSGRGIRPEDLPRVFDSFFTTKTADRGTGLGLSAVKQIVESYGGTISVESQHDRWTAVTFDLPDALSARTQRDGTRRSGR